MKRIFGTQGFRGRVDDSLTSTVAHDIGISMAQFLGYKKTIGVAWDTRISSEMLSLAISAGVMAGGCNVHLLGLGPTPLLSFAIPRLKLDGGIMITASHNPPEFNGIKLWGPDGSSFTENMERQVESYYFAKDKTVLPWNMCGYLVPSNDFRPTYIEKLVNQVDYRRLRKEKLCVVADCGGGAASTIIPTLFQRIGFESELLSCTPDGLFKDRLPEPKEKNLGNLIHCVKEKGANLGMAWDGDADRIVLITGQGRFLMGDRTFTLATYHRLQGLDDSKKIIVTQVATSDVIRDVAKEVNAEVVETRVGEPNIVSMMKQVNAQIGGEENGGVIYQGWSWAREGLLTALIILDLMTRKEQTLEELDQRFPRYVQVKESIPCENEKKSLLLDRVTQMAPTDAECQTLDGLKLRYSDGWLLLRPSGTEPIFRVFTEAKTQTRCRTLAKIGLKLAKDAYSEIKTDKD